MKCTKLTTLSLAAILILAGLSWGQDSLNVTRLGSIYAQLNGGEDVVLRGEYAYVASEGLAVMNASNPQVPVLIGYCGFPGEAQGLAIQGNYAYVAGYGGGLQIVDITNPTRPVQTGFLEMGNLPRDVTVSGNYAYVANIEWGLRVVDVSQPNNPIEVGFYDPPGGGVCTGVAISGDYAFVTRNSLGVMVVDISDPTHPAPITTLDTPGWAVAIALSGNYAYVADLLGGLRILNITDPANPSLMGGLSFSSGPDEIRASWVAVSGQYAYVGVYGDHFPDCGLRIVDISDPWYPTLVGQCNEPGCAGTMAVSGDYVYVSGGYPLTIVNVSSPAHPTLLGHYYAPGHAICVKTQGDYAYLADQEHGFRIIDIADPSNPLEVGFNETTNPYFLDVSGHYAYVMGEDAGYELYVMDVSQPSSPTVVGICEDIAGILAVSGNHAYVTEGGYLRVVDVSDPSQPTIMAELNYEDKSYTYGITIAGDYAYMTTWEYLHVVDISNPANPVAVGACHLETPQGGVAVAGDYAYVACRENGLRVVNISNPHAPVEISWIDTPGQARSVTISGDYAYVGDYEGGLYVVNISHPASPAIAGFYVTPGLALDVAVAGSSICVAESYSMGIYQYSQPNVTINLIPIISPILIPANGGSFEYYLFAENSGPGNQTVDLWTKAILPGGSILSPIMGPVSVSLDSGTTGWIRNQNVPGRAAAGLYNYIACAGDYPGNIWASDTLQFTKLESGDGGLVSDWENTGEPFSVSDELLINYHSALITACRPNPFNPTTAISCQLSADSHVKLEVFDTAGRLVATLVDGWRDAGTHEVKFDGSNLPSGIYLAKITANDESQTQKLVLMK